MFANASGFGSLSPEMYLDITASVTPMRPANSFCVIPRFCKVSVMREPNSFPIVALLSALSSNCHDFFELSRLLYLQLAKMSRYIAVSKVRLAHLTLSNKKAIPGNENQVSPFYRTPVRQLHYTGNVLILFYWKHPQEWFFSFYDVLSCISVRPRPPVKDVLCIGKTARTN